MWPLADRRADWHHPAGLGPGNEMYETTPKMLLAGRILSGLAVLLLLTDSAMTFACPPVLQEEMKSTGFDISAHWTIGLISLVSTLLYALPRTATLGAILLTGFLGGAICTHVRVDGLGSPPEIVSLVLGLLVWSGLYLRDARLRAILPLRS